jgi:hypothetical protein
LGEIFVFGFSIRVGVAHPTPLALFIFIDFYSKNNNAIAAFLPLVQSTIAINLNSSRETFCLAI